MKKRILSFFLAGIMACSMVPAETFAASADVGDTTGTRMEAPELAGQSLPDGDGSAAEGSVQDRDAVAPEEGAGQGQTDAPEGEAAQNRTVIPEGDREQSQTGMPEEDAGQNQTGVPEEDAPKEGISREDGIAAPAGQEEPGNPEELPDMEVPERERSSRQGEAEDNGQDGAQPEANEIETLPSGEPESLSGAGDAPEAQTPENRELPMGGMVRPKAVEISSEQLAELGVTVEEKAEKDLSYYSKVLGSRKYDSSWDVYSTNYIYNRLSQRARNFWDALEAGVKGYLDGFQNAEAADVPNEFGRTERYYYAGEASYSLYGLSQDEAASVFLLFCYSNPQYYFIGNGYLVGTDTRTGQRLMRPMVYDEFASGSSRAAATAKMKAQVEIMGAKIAAGKTDLEKAKIAHDLICQKIMYDPGFDLGNIENSNPYSKYHQSAYSVFCEDYTVCAGYTKAFTLLMNGAGVDTISVTSEAHAWNLVSLNDSWYNIDCTWDDTDGQLPGYGAAVYDYFNRSTAMIRGTKLDKGSGYHQTEYFYKGLIPDATQDSGATSKSIGTIFTPPSSAKVAAPKVSRYNGSQSVWVTLSTSTSGADIYYTLDGVDPSSAATRSYLYTEPFEIEYNTTVKAIAVRDTMWDSKVVSESVKKYTVKFDSRGGSKVSSKQVVPSKKVGKPSAPKRSKYTFAGWYTSPSLKTKWNFNNKVTKNMTLYAKWKKVSVGKASIKKLANVSGKKLKVTIKKASDVKGYQIRYATNSKMKSYKNTTTTSASKTLSKLVKGKKYYVKVRAYKLDSKKEKVYGAWSKVKSLRIRK